jgi:predicted alpha/beta superfamily hydrolase
MCQQYPQKLGACAAISPALGWDDAKLCKELVDKPDSLRSVQVWLDIGTEEGSEPVLAIQHCEHLAAALRKQGGSVEWRKVEGGRHNEQAWAARFGDILEFLYKP